MKNSSSRKISACRLAAALPSCSSAAARQPPRLCSCFRAGFTLIELLVVIAIIMILARLLLMTVKSAKDRANQAQCASNLQQLGRAFAMYISDYGFYPKAAKFTGVNPIATFATRHDRSNWVRLVRFPKNQPYYNQSCSPIGTRNYITNPGDMDSALGQYANPSDKPCKDVSVYWCPADGINQSTPTSQYWVLVSYQMNYGLTPGGNHIVPNMVIHPSATYLIMEEYEMYNPWVPTGSANDDGAAECKGTGSTYRTTDRHAGGSNALFCDGHVSWARKGNSNDYGSREYDIVRGRGCWYGGKSPSGTPDGDATAY